MTPQLHSTGSAPGVDQGRALTKIAPIASAESLLDLNGCMRDLLAQHRKKALTSKEFIYGYSQLFQRAADIGMDYYIKFNTFAPLYTESSVLAGMQSDMAGLTEYAELQQEADLLRAGILNLEGYRWELRWNFLMERAADLGYYWVKETKQFK